jgi:copper(I)-binding protein
MPRLQGLFATLVLSIAAFASATEGVRVTGAWARASAPGQKVAGIYLNIVSDTSATLTAAESPLAGAAELHQMRMEAGTMRMRQVEAIELPAGRTVSLKPGDFHVMLFDLKKALVAGERVPITLTVIDAEGAKRRLDVSAKVRNLDGSDPGEHH